MEMYTAEQFLKDVRKEAKAIRRHATPEEIDNLSLKTFDPKYHKHCIYGQMTGDCFSRRAADIIFNCCPRYFHSEYAQQKEQDITLAIKFVNGESIAGVGDHESLFNSRENYERFHFSAIEAYIMLPDAKNENLIAYLKGETDTLEL